MEFSKEFDKLNVPIYICSSDWKVIYRNKTCRRYTPLPRLNSDMSRVFLDRENTFFQNGSNIELICCKIKQTYKTALCFRYHGNAVILFPTLLEYDILCSGMFDKIDENTFDSIVHVFDAISDSENMTSDKFGVIEKIRNYTFSAIDNYVALSYFDTQNRCKSTVTNLYRIFGEKIIETAGKAGYKTETRLSSLDSFCDKVCVDTAYFSMVFVSFLLFCLGISIDKKCIVSASNTGMKIRTEFVFSCDKEALFGRSGSGLKEFMAFYPTEYLNLMPFEDICASLCWNCGYSVDKAGSLNANIFFDIDVKGSTVFNSPGKTASFTTEKIVSDIFDIISNSL